MFYFVNNYNLAKPFIAELKCIFFKFKMIFLLCSNFHKIFIDCITFTTNSNDPNRTSIVHLKKILSPNNLLNLEIFFRIIAYKILLK